LGEVRLYGRGKWGVKSGRGRGEVRRRGLRREVSEEVEIGSELSLEPVGVINEETNEVGSVHLGFMFRMEVSGEVRVRETEKLEGLWVKKSELASLREQMEETGTAGENYISLGNLYPSPGYCGEIIRIWACRVAQKGEMHLDEDEFLEVERIPLDKAVEMVLNNEIPDSKTQVGILKTAALVKAGKL